MLGTAFRSLREEVYRASLTKASSGELDNGPIINKILSLRQETAKLLGFQNYGQVSMASKVRSYSKQFVSVSDGKTTDRWKGLESRAGCAQYSMWLSRCAKSAGIQTVEPSYFALVACLWCIGPAILVWSHSRANVLLSESARLGRGSDDTRPTSSAEVLQGLCCPCT